jgi:RNA polymerase sigma factor (sigma-70 family)
MLKAGYYATHPDKQEELRLLQHAKSQDSETARSAADSLLRTNEGFLKTTVWQWSQLGIEFNFDEVLAEAYEAFYKSILHFDLSHGVSIRTYSRYHLLEVRKRLQHQWRWVEFKPTHYTESCTIELPKFIVFNLSKILSDALDVCLTLIEREVIYLHYIKGMKKRMIANHRSCSEARISTIVKNALPKLRSWLVNHGIESAFFEQN